LLRSLKELSFGRSAQTRPLRRLMLIGLLLPLALSIAATAYDYWSKFNEARNELTELTYALHEHTLKVIETQSLILKLVAAEIGDRPVASLAGDRRLYDRLVEMTSNHPQVDGIFILDAAGDLAVHSRAFPARAVNFADRDYFVAQRDTDGGLFIGSLLRGRISGHPIFNVSIRLTDGAGRFQGVAGISLSVPYFNDFYGRLSTRENYAVSLSRLDGALLSRYPRIPDDLTAIENSLRVAFADPGAAKDGFTEIASAVDGTRRIFAYRRIEGYPLMIGIGFDKALILRTWAIEALILMTLGLACGLGFLLAVAAVHKGIRDRETDLVNLREASQKLAAEIADRRRAEDAAIAMATEARAADSAKSQFLASMSHELRTPLNAIIGFSEMIELGLAGPVGGKAKDYVSDIRQSAELLHGIIGDLLDLTNMDTGKMELRESVCDLAEVTRKAIAMVMPAAGARGIAIPVAATASHTIYRVDPRACRQVLGNLLANAVKFAPAGSTIEVVFRDAADGVEWVIADRGPGLRGQSESDLFRPFRRTVALVAKDNEGLGLGLPISRRLAEMHGGRLSVADRPGGGLVARFSLPATRAAEMRPAARAEVSR